MPEFELSELAQHWVNVVLIWIGFGSLAGLLARVLLPVGHPSGPVPTLVLGIAGSALGLWGLTLLWSDRPINPISPLGFLAATAGAFFLLVLYRLIYACCPKRRQDPPCSP